jgi:hypothetical protein
VKRTGDIKGFVITEESGIAKGIRRIIAVTGQEASDASREANALSAELDRIDKMTGKEKDTRLKAFAVVSIYREWKPPYSLTDNRSWDKQIFLFFARRDCVKGLHQFEKRLTSS